MTVYLVYRDATDQYHGADLEDMFSSLEKAESYVEDLIKAETTEYSYKKIDKSTWENEYQDRFYIVKKEVV